MLRWPEKFKWIEGLESPVKYWQGTVRRISRFMDNLYIRTVPLPKTGITDKNYNGERIIVSLTSYPQRVDKLFYAVKSIMLQSVKANRIVLWLSIEQYPEKKLPEKYNKLIERGLEVRYVEGDMGSHKKYLYMLPLQKENELVITFDDDLIYEKKAIERLLETHSKFPSNVICNRGHELSNSGKGDFVLSRSFRTLYSDEGVGAPSSLIVPSTGAGCLYPYNILPSKTFDREDIIKLAPRADDIWIWYQCYVGRIGIVKTKKESRVLSEVYGKSNDCLCKYNDNGGNQEVLDRLNLILAGNGRNIANMRNRDAINPDSECFD